MKAIIGKYLCGLMFDVNMTLGKFFFESRKYMSLNIRCNILIVR